MAKADPLSYCADQVRRFDRDRFLTALFVPPDRREAVFALAAFNLEVAKTREVVTEPMLGQIRLQWWREAVDEIYAGRPRRHEVVAPLHDAVSRHRLTRAHLDALIDAREADLTDTAPPTLADLEAYAGDTATPLIRLCLEVLDVRDGPAHDAAGPIGTAYAMAGLIRAIPFHARQRRVTLPTALVEEVAVDMGELFELRPHEALSGAVRRLVDRAEEHLADAAGMRRQVPKAAVPALLPAVVARSHLRQLRRCGHDVFDARIQRPAPLLSLRLMGHAWRRTY